MKVRLVNLFVEPCDVETVGAGEVSRGGIAACVANANHGNVVFIQVESMVAVQEHVPKLNGWDALLALGKCGSNDFSLWSRVAHTALFLGNALKGSECVGLGERER